MILLSFLLAYVGLMLAALSMQRHHRDLFGGPPPASRIRDYRIAGYILIGLACWPCVQYYGATIGLVAWLGLLSACGIALVGVLALQSPRAMMLSLGLFGSAPALAVLLAA